MVSLDALLNADRTADIPLIDDTIVPQKSTLRRRDTSAIILRQELFDGELQEEKYH
jgi:hypothetical protein